MHVISKILEIVLWLYMLSLRYDRVSYTHTCVYTEHCCYRTNNTLKMHVWVWLYSNNTLFWIITEFHQNFVIKKVIKDVKAIFAHGLNKNWKNDRSGPLTNELSYIVCSCIIAMFTIYFHSLVLSKETQSEKIKSWFLLLGLLITDLLHHFCSQLSVFFPLCCSQKF